MKLVKLYPYNKRMGWVMRSYTLTGVGKNSVRFQGERGWYEVEDSIADRLRSVPQQDRYPIDLGGKPAFMIADDTDGAVVLDDRIDSMQSKHIEESVGTASTPVRATRPGTIQEPAPRTRSRKRTRGGD